VERRGRAVVVDAHPVDEREIGAAGAHLGQLFLERLVRLADARFQIFQDVVHHGLDSSSVTNVPIDSPSTTRRILPRERRSNTTIASLLSRHSEIAVESITFKLRCKTSI